MSAAHLDGNAVSGLLFEIFGAEMTSALGVCDSCGAERRVGELHVYVRAPGSVVRCPECTAVLMCVVWAGSRTWVNLRGLRTLEVQH